MVLLPWPKKSLEPRNSWGWSTVQSWMSCNIELRFDIVVTHTICASRARDADGSRCRMISHDHTADQSHEYLACNDFFGQGSTCTPRSCSSQGWNGWKVQMWKKRLCWSPFCTTAGYGMTSKKPETLRLVTKDLIRTLKWVIIHSTDWVRGCKLTAMKGHALCHSTHSHTRGERSFWPGTTTVSCFRNPYKVVNL